MLLRIPLESHIFFEQAILLRNNSVTRLQNTLVLF
ncbi:hypothetical protein KM92DES2_11137 [uncultured Desulfovibrio sp.]|uniref:Uncharacterized protein n=1 Tax=uncultured Desulfovibrio sp. TaxID=167968 RepID=A0A212JHS9_9BACT|nr:hypothetical protein KM92DES2_11137 [uncultured Desulfovibrio sp.]